jgi:DNA-directed RNA polymerase specialized sigma24 family protein
MKEAITRAGQDLRDEQRLEALSPFVAVKDRELLRLYWGGMQVRRLAAVLNVAPSTVSRRVRAVERRVLRREVDALAKGGRSLSERDRVIALMHYAGGVRAHGFAERFGIGRRKVQTVLRRVKTWLRQEMEGERYAS